MSRRKNFFSDPARRPQLIVWAGVVAVAGVLLVAGSVIGTSTNWFCTAPCHIVHADNTLAFNKSSHVMASCVACHEPLNGSPLTFVLMKMEVAPDLIPTVANTFDLPMNESQHIAFSMPSEQCTQCHDMENRTVNPSAGLIINHEAHAAENINCTACHNRVAHPEEDVTYALDGDKKHENWMSMDACFRCHGLAPDAKAPGKCTACHTADFNLVPASHAAPGWYQQYGDSRGHAAAYSEEASRVAAAQTWVQGLQELEDTATAGLGYVQTVNTCYTCHLKQFCTDCHGVEMPHPAEFATNHGTAGLANPAVCAKCHARSENEAVGYNFCSACHHPQGTPGTPWINQHFNAVKTQGASVCFQCHNPRYCSACHIGGADAAKRYLQDTAGQ